MLSLFASVLSLRRQAASIPNRRVEANHDSIAIRDMLTRLCHMHGKFDVHATDSVDDFETALSTLIEDRYAEGLREAGILVPFSSSAAQPA